MIRKFIQCLMLSMFCATPLVAMTLPDDEASYLVRRKFVIYSLSEESTEEGKTTRKDNYKFGTAFCLLGGIIYQQGALAGISTMMLGGFLCYKGWMAPSMDHFD